MKQRLHQYLLTCDRCDKKTIVLHTFDRPYPEGWIEINNLDSPEEPFDYCPVCAVKLKGGESDEEAA
jgi:hypothetical protein